MVTQKSLMISVLKIPGSIPSIFSQSYSGKDFSGEANSDETPTQDYYFFIQKREMKASSIL